MNVSLTPVNQNIPCLKNVTEKEFRCVVDYFLRKPHKQTARELNISPTSVKTYLRRVSKKTDLSQEEIFYMLLECGVFKSLLKKRVQK